jgi:hypothetical protein
VFAWRKSAARISFRCVNEFHLPGNQFLDKKLVGSPYRKGVAGHLPANSNTNYRSVKEEEKLRLAGQRADPPGASPVTVKRGAVSCIPGTVRESPRLAGAEAGALGGLSRWSWFSAWEFEAVRTGFYCSTGCDICKMPLKLLANRISKNR